MIDFPTLDLLLLAVIALGYVVRGKTTVVLHDPISGALAGFGLADAAAVPAVAEAAAIPEIASAAALPGIAAGADIAGTAGALGVDAFGASAPLAASAGSLAGDLGAGGLLSGAAGPIGTAAGGAPLGAGFGLAPDVTTQAAALAPGGALDLTGGPGAALSPASIAGGEVPATASVADTSALGATPASTAATTGVPTTGTTGTPGVGSTVADTGNYGGGGTTTSSGVGGWLEKNWDKVAKIGASGLGLLMSGAGGPTQLPAQAQLQNAASTAQTNAQTLQGYQITGTLPPGMKQIVDLNNSAAKAAIRSQYADLGYAGSTAEAQALQQVDQASAAQIAQMASQLAQQGMSFAQLSAQEFENLLNVQLKNEQDYQAALGRFASGLAGALG